MKENLNGSGIYTITNILDNKILVGYASCFSDRKSRHFGDLKYNRHGNPHLQNAYNLYGKENFIFEILEEYPKNINILASAENFWAIMLNTHNRDIGYNIKPTSHDGKVKASEETKRRQSEAQMGKIRSREAVEKIRIANTGKKRSKEFCEKLSLLNKGKGPSKEALKKASIVNTGKKHTKERVEKMLLTRSSKSKEEKQVIIDKAVASRKGYSHSEETKKKISESNKNKKNLI